MSAGAGARRIETVGRTWELLAREDPLWAVLTHRGKRGNRWRPDEFFEHGRKDVSAELERAGRLRPGFPRRVALDFGCGPGRLTRALAKEFDRVIGLDVSPEMVRLAREFNADVPTAEFRLNEGPALESVADGTIDFAISLLTLQHIGGAAALGYIDELTRVLAPDGVLVFGVPGGRDWPGAVRHRLATLPRRALDDSSGPKMEMHQLDRAQVERVVGAAGGRVIERERRDDAGPGWIAHTWVVARR